MNQITPAIAEMPLVITDSRPSEALAVAIAPEICIIALPSVNRVSP